jgi:hypothetical protein
MNTIIFRPKPWWLDIFTRGRWVAFAPYIYCPVKSIENYPTVIAHEKKHIQQQLEIGKWRWLLKYFVNKCFRLNQEIEAVVIEIAATENIAARKAIAERYAHQLSGPGYFHAAPNYDLALGLILHKAKAEGVEL